MALVLLEPAKAPAIMPTGPNMAPPTAPLTIEEPRFFEVSSPMTSYLSIVSLFKYTRLALVKPAAIKGLPLSSCMGLFLYSQPTTSIVAILLYTPC